MMPYYEGLTNLGLINEKHTTVVFDFGYAFTKVGFAGEMGPRDIIRSEVKCRQSGKLVPVFDCQIKEELCYRLVDFIHNIYFKHLLVNPKDRRVVVVENILDSSVKKNALAAVFFKYYEVLSLVFVPSHLVSLMTLGIPTGLVLDIGYNEASVIPVYEGVPILCAWQSVLLGSKAIKSSLWDLLLDRGLYIEENQQEQRLSPEKRELVEEVLEDIRVRCCLVSTIERSEKLQSNKYDRSIEPPPPPPSVKYPLYGNSILFVPGTVREMASEVLFEVDEDNLSLPAILLQAILMSPLDVRKSLAQNIVVIGGTASMTGLKCRLLDEIRHLASLPPFCEQTKVNTFKIHVPPAKDNYVAWLGGAIMGCTEASLVRSQTKESYLETGVVPDWCNLSFNMNEDESSRIMG